MNALKRHGVSLARCAATSTATITMQIAVFCARAEALPAGIPFKQSTANDDGMVYRAIGAFLLAGAAAYGLAWCIRHFMPSFGKKMLRGKQLERLETMRLSTRSMLVRVRWGSEELLLGENEHGVSLIGKRPFPSSISTMTADTDFAATSVPETTAVSTGDSHV